MSKSTFNTVTSLTRFNAGEVATSRLTEVGFLMGGTTKGGTDVLKPVSKRDFVKQHADRAGSKSAAAREYYTHLSTFTKAARMDFNAALDNGYKLAARKISAGGRRTYSLFEPKADTSGSSANTSLAKENADLKARLAKLEAVLLAAASAE